MPSHAVRRTRNAVALILLVFCAFAVVAVLILARTASENYRELAAQMARSFFRSVVATRSWNAQHGGVYVPVTERFQPNPYLEDPLRDVQTAEGLRLTKVNPAYMTRLIGERFEEEAGVRIHITSLKPIRPGNAPDSWERGALTGFEKGNREVFAVVDDGRAKQFRYMAPLVTKQACLACHAGQGYRLNDIRGGISVSFDYAPFEAALRAHDARILLWCIGLSVVGGGMIAALGRRLVASVEEVDESLSRVKTLEGLLPICSFCKKIRRDEADPSDPSSWEPVEDYLEEKTDALFSHGYCPDCMEKHYPDFGGRK